MSTEWKPQRRLTVAQTECVDTLSFRLWGFKRNLQLLVSVEPWTRSSHVNSELSSNSQQTWIPTASWISEREASFNKKRPGLNNAIAGGSQQPTTNNKNNRSSDNLRMREKLRWVRRVRGKIGLRWIKLREKYDSSNCETSLIQLKKWAACHVHITLANLKLSATGKAWWIELKEKIIKKSEDEENWKMKKSWCNHVREQQDPTASPIRPDGCTPRQRKVLRELNVKLHWSGTWSVVASTAGYVDISFVESTHTMLPRWGREWWRWSGRRSPDDYEYVVCDLRSETQRMTLTRLICSNFTYPFGRSVVEVYHNCSLTRQQTSHGQAVAA